MIITKLRFIKSFTMMNTIDIVIIETINIIFCSKELLFMILNLIVDVKIVGI